MYGRWMCLPSDFSIGFGHKLNYSWLTRVGRSVNTEKVNHMT